MSINREIFASAKSEALSGFAATSAIEGALAKWKTPKQRTTKAYAAAKDAAQRAHAIGYVCGYLMAAGALSSDCPMESCAEHYDMIVNSKPSTSTKVKGNNRRRDPIEDKALTALRQAWKRALDASGHGAPKAEKKPAANDDKAEDKGREPRQTVAKDDTGETVGKSEKDRIVTASDLDAALADAANRMVALINSLGQRAKRKASPVENRHGSFVVAVKAAMKEFGIVPAE